MYESIYINKLVTGSYLRLNVNTAEEKRTTRNEGVTAK